MRIRTKLFGGFGVYVTARLIVISEIAREVKEASIISQAALDFNVENFHTQFEVWEYTYEPNVRALKHLRSTTQH